MPRSTRSKLFLVAMATVGLCACSDNTTTTPTTSTATTTETFNGTLTINGAATFSFTAATAGTVTATLTTLSPDSTLVVGLSLGTWNGTACQIVIANDAATQGTVVTGTAQTAGTLCARIYDVGNLVNSETYVITAVHP